VNSLCLYGGKSGQRSRRPSPLTPPPWVSPQPRGPSIHNPPPQSSGPSISGHPASRRWGTEARHLEVYTKGGEVWAVMARATSPLTVTPNNPHVRVSCRSHLSGLHPLVWKIVHFIPRSTTIAAAFVCRSTGNCPEDRIYDSTSLNAVPVVEIRATRGRTEGLGHKSPCLYPCTDGIAPQRWVTQGSVELRGVVLVRPRRSQRLQFLLGG